MSFFSKMMSIDRRIIYIILAAAIIYPMYLPFGFKVAAEEPAEAMYDYLMALPAGSTVIFSGDLSSSGLTELKPMVEVLVSKSLEAKHKVLLMALWAEGNNLIDAWTQKIFADAGAVYGTDYIHLGYVPSYTAFLESSRTDLKNAFNGGVDKNRNKLDTYPIMDGINKASDIDMVISFGTGDPGYTHWIQQWGATGECKAIGGGQVAVNYPTALNQYNAGNMVGVAGGLSGAATLEMCAGIVGSAHGASDMQSFGHLAIVFFLIIGNVGYFGAKKAGEVK